MDIIFAFFLYFAFDATVFEDGSMSNGTCVAQSLCGASTFQP